MTELLGQKASALEQLRQEKEAARIAAIEAEAQAEEEKSEFDFQEQ